MFWKSSARLAIAFTLGACGSGPSEPDPESLPEIVRVGQGLWTGQPSGPFQIHVVSDPSDCGIIFDIDSATALYDSRTGLPWPAGQEILVVGARVHVQFRLVNQSCPGQSYASRVMRLH